jgi:hypothetical protein
VALEQVGVPVSLAEHLPELQHVAREYGLLL